jgi:hypothetical protein
VNSEFFFLLRFEEPHFPIPDLQLGGHQPVCFLQTELAFQVDFRAIVHIESDCRTVTADVFAEASDESLRARKRFLAPDLQVDGSFRKRLEKIFVREQHAQDSRRHPEQQRALFRTCQTVTRHPILPA